MPRVNRDFLPGQVWRALTALFLPHLFLGDV
jgi:hypothetical protein